MLSKFSQIVNRLYAFIYETNLSKSGLGLPSIVSLVMVIDTSWIYLGRHEKAFFTGLTKFVEHCKPLVNSSGNVKCPCKSCRNVSWVSILELPRHITNNGWDPSYNTWTNHGEPNVLPPVIHNTTQPQMRSDGTAVFPKKVLRYFLIIPRLQHLYKSSHTVKEMTWHATGKCTKPGKIQHPVNGRAWKNFDTKYPNFTKEPRNVRSGLAADGFNPFGNLSQSYSMWPMILTTYNLPPWLCVETIDVATGHKFNMRAMVLWTINDFPDRSSLSGWSGQGYRACPTCNEDTPSMRVLGKTAYVGHRRFLKKPHKWRRSHDFNGEIKNGDPL
uniref:Transposase-associated domain-containing protein n=1 Tax=Tanacetum cinerariifolium TaxID=118510 RepID=A0A699IPV1_TANCI|nr:hypothetical protein [Tanacetum cinerariifolium]